MPDDTGLSGARAETGELVRALAMLEQLGIVDFNGHGSVRLSDGTILINSGASTRSALTPDDIVAISGEGELLAGTAKPPMEFHIHTEIYRRRPDVNAVLHGHPEMSTFLTATDTPVRPVFAQGCLMDGLPVFPSPLSVNTRTRGEAVADALGAHRGILLRAHGSVVVGATLREAFVLAVYLEQNCGRQYKESLIGTPYVFDADEVAACEANLFKPNLFDKCWNYYAAKLPG